MKKVNWAFQIVLILISVLNANSQCEIKTTLAPTSVSKSTMSGARIGQTFTACQDGFIESIGLQVNNYIGPNFSLYISSPTGGLLAGPHQSFQITSIPISPSGFQIIVLDPPFPVVSGNEYEYQVENGDVLELGLVNDEITGICTLDGNIVVTGVDLSTHIEIIPDTNQCIIATELAPTSVSKSTMSGARIGQTFTACQDGFIESIGLQVNNYIGPNFSLYISSPTGGLLAGPHQSFQITSIPISPSGFQIIVLDPPFPVVSGNEYEYQVENGDVLELGLVNDEITGICTLDGRIVATGVDLSTQIIISPAPIFSKEFADSEVNQFKSTTLTFTIDNTLNNVAGSNFAFTDNLPDGIEVASNPNITNTCGGSVMADAESTSISLTGGMAAAGSTCAITVDVTLQKQGILVNQSGDLISSLGNSGPATATILGLVPIPTFSQWGLIVLSMIMLIMGLIFVRQKKLQFG